MKLHRRQFLRGAAGVSLALPLLPSASSRAGVGTPPKRMVFWFTANGTVHGEIASGGEHDFTLGSILAPLSAHRDDLLILRGIDMESSYHGLDVGSPHGQSMAHMLTGTELQDTDPYNLAGDVSVDQYIAQQLAAPTRFPTIDLGVAPGLNPSVGTANMSYRGPGDPVIRELDPANAFDRFFADLGGDVQHNDRLRQRRLSILDFVRAEARDLEQTLGSEDRVRLEQHLEAVRSLEQSLSTLGELPPACTLPDDPPALDLGAPGITPQVGGLHVELLATALACDLARVATLQWGGALGGNGMFSWLGHSRDHHTISHDGSATGRQQKAEIDAWYAGQLAELVDRLKALPEGDGTVFDNTAIVWVNELSSGQAHDRRDMVYVIAGSCAGYFDTGRFLTYAGDPHNDLLVSLCRAMDLPTSTFGNPAYCNGPLSGLI